MRCVIGKKHASTSRWYEMWISALKSDGKKQSFSSREAGDAGAAALLRPQHGVWAHRNAGGAGAFVWGAPGSRSHRGVSLWAQAVPVYPSPSATDLLLRNTIWDCHRCRRMLPIKGGPRCVWACVHVCDPNPKCSTLTSKTTEATICNIKCHKLISALFQ